MPLRTPNRGDTVQYRATSGETRNMIVQYKQESAPATPASSTSTTGGTLAAATYSYRVSKVVNGIETTASTAKTQATTGATSTVTVDFSSGYDTRATSYKVYGRVGGSELLMATVANPTTSFVDDGSVTPAGALPSATTAVTLWDPYGALRTGVAKATTNKSTNAYFLRY